MSKTAHVTDRKMSEIKQEINKDPNMQLLIKHIRTGWPSSNTQVPSEIREYHKHREELSVDNGVIYKGQNILIPPRLRHDTLKKLHASHQGMEKSKRLARQCIFWPGMSKQIEDTVSNCESCIRHRNANCREPLMPHAIPDRPWQKVATDLLDFKGRTHLLLVDYYSRYPEVSELKDMSSRTVIRKTKSIFSRHGIPEELISDNGTQFTSQEFKEFSEDYDFKLTTISPRYPQSGGMHERAVQTVKDILYKCEETGDDPYIALLQYRNTPIDGISPAQALMSRTLRSNLPVSEKNLKPTLVDPKIFKRDRVKSQNNQRKYHDRSAKPLPELHEGDNVHFKLDPQKAWKPAVVTTKHDTPRSYMVKTDDGSEYRRNRRHLIKHRTSDLAEQEQSEPLTTTPTTQDETSPESSEDQSGFKVSRYGRIIKPNPKYQD